MIDMIYLYCLIIAVRKFEYLFIFLFIGCTIVILLVPKRIIYKPADKTLHPSKKRLSYFQVVMLISSVISLIVIMLVKFLIDT